MRYKLLFILIPLLTFSAYSQDKTIELPTNNYSQGYDVYPIDTSGVFVVERTGQVKSRNLVKQVYHLDTDLEIQNVFSIQMDDRYQKISFQSDANGVYYLYQKRLLKNELAVMHVKPNGEYDVTEIPLVETMDIRHFHVTDGNILIGGIFEFKPTFWLYRMETGRLIALRGSYDNNVQLKQSCIHADQGVMSIMTANQHNIRFFDFEIRHFDLEGNFLRMVNLQPPGGEYINHAVVSDFVGTEQFVYGDYTDKNKRGHSGIFVAKIKANGEVEYNMSPYFKIPGFYTRFPDKRAQRKKQKAEEQMTKKGAWATSEGFSFYLPHLYNDKIYVAAVSTHRSDENVYQFAFNLRGQIAGMSVTRFQKWQTSKLLNQLNKNDRPIGLNWVHNDEFYFVSKWRAILTTRIMNIDGVQAYESKNPLVFENRVFGLNNRGMNYWYDNRILTSGRIYPKGSTIGEFVLTSWTLDAN